MRGIYAALLLLLTSHAWAQSLCPGSVSSWSTSLPSPMAFATYDLTNNPPGLPNGVLTVVFQNPTATMVYVAVPQLTSTSWGLKAYSYQYYTGAISPVYHSTLVYVGTNCPVLGVSGYAVWTQ